MLLPIFLLALGLGLSIGIIIGGFLEYSRSYERLVAEFVYQEELLEEITRLNQIVKR